jgi:amino acid adenylation domain-containing protein
VTFAALEARANQLARALDARGVGAGDRVGIFFIRGPEALAAMLATMKLGAAYVPLDPDYPSDRLALMVEDSGVRLIVSAQAPDERAGWMSGREVLALDVEQGRLATLEDTPLKRTVPGNAVACMVYTSGSTGRPKGVMATHSAALNRFRWMWEAYPFAPDEVVAHKTPLSFIDAVWEMFGPLLQGIRIHAIRKEELGGSVEILANAGVTRLVAVPSFLRALLLSHPDLEERLPRLRYWTVSGEEFRPSDWRLFRERLPRARLLNLYGSSELAADVTFAELGPYVPEARCSIGKPISNNRAYVLDEQLSRVKPGEVGELFVGGANLALGYWKNPDTTAWRFVPDPFSGQKGERLFRTGDLVRERPDGDLEYLGRSDSQVKVRGHRVELGEVEAALRKLPGVTDGVVIPRDGDAGLAAYYVGEHNSVRESLSGVLPDFMVPTAYVRMDALPQTPSGKVDRTRLPKVSGERTQPFVEPTDELEIAMARLWEAFLGVRVGRLDDFYELGGTSLAALRLAWAVKERLGRELDTSVLAGGATLARVCETLRLPTRGQRRAIEIRAGRGRPLFLGHPINGSVLCYRDLATRLPIDVPVYGLQARGLEDDGEPLTSVSDMAAELISEMQRLQPKGPYRLGGWSLGGVIALETALLLTQQGEVVEFLAIFDTAILREPLWADDAETLLLVGGVDQDPPWRQDEVLSPEQRMLRAIDRVREVTLPPSHLPWSRTLSQESPLPELRMQEAARLLHLHRCHARAWREYLEALHEGKKNFPGTLHYFLTQSLQQGGSRTDLDEVRRFWTGRARKVEIIDVPGCHGFMMREDQSLEVMVTTLGRVLSS